MISQKNTLRQGFTIVELLIVIVVIGILAAITIVAYNGISNRSKLASAQSTANTVAKKAEAWNSIQGSYPTYAQLRTNKTDAAGDGTSATAGNANYQGATAGPGEAKLDDPSLITNNTSPAVSAANGVNTVHYVVCGTTGARIHYWNYSLSSQRLTLPTDTTNPSLTVGTGC